MCRQLLLDKEGKFEFVCRGSNDKQVGETPRAVSVYSDELKSEHVSKALSRLLGAFCVKQ